MCAQQAKQTPWKRKDPIPRDHTKCAMSTTTITAVEVTLEGVNVHGADMRVAVAMKLCDVVEPHGLVCAGALSDTATTMVLVSTILLRMTCTMLWSQFVALSQHLQAPQQQHCP